ncbi:carcinoembryonic antigen-related cell adhesion molecule 5-like [Monodelphis domestica]|uniref:carcinoembryonic antigen-related cell adhesion molecule 5-like n=1 Tax=Monodelphis domestica TaxID=13616 RepID=UPI0024E20A69|nr:carcinoembryonic antigen-related cell adhesion molecule 5-like [Monodelphis domestica]
MILPKRRHGLAVMHAKEFCHCQQLLPLQHSHFLSILCTAPLSKPTILTSNNTAVETKDFSLTCNSTGQIHAYKWFINGVAPAGRRIQLSPDRRTLTLSSLTRSVNKGPYVCEIENPFYRNRSDPFTLDVAVRFTCILFVHGAPLSKPTILTSNNTEVETKDFSLTCYATGQIHAYKWFINGVAPAGRRIQLSPDRRTLTLRSLTRSVNKGPYVCEIENPFYRNRKYGILLFLPDGPDIATIVHSADEYPTGANITLSCVADSNPTAQFTWLHNGQPVSNSATFSIIASLSDAGTYTCTASNSFTGLTCTATKNITIYAPVSKPTIVTSNITAVETKDFSLTCQATGQIHTYQWFINGVAPAGSRIQLSPDKRTLTLSRLTRRDNKTPYECEIRNPFYSNRSDPFTLDGQANSVPSLRTKELGSDVPKALHL